MAGIHEPDSGRTLLAVRVPWSATAALVVLFGCEVLLLSADLVVWNLVDATELSAIFDLTLESNLPTFFASTQALAVGVACLLVMSAHRDAKEPTWRRLGWLGTAGFFLFVAMDDASQFHERVATAWSASIKAAAEPSIGKAAVDSFASYYWQLLILPFFIVAGIAIVLFAVRELRGLRRAWLFLAGIGFFAVAVLLDHLDPLDRVYEPAMEVFRASFAAVQHAFRATEESIEMFGTSCILVAVTGHFALVTGSVRERASPGYGRLITTMVAAVGGIAALAAAILVVSWVAVRSVPQIAVARAQVPIEQGAADLVVVDARALAVLGLSLGMTPTEVRRLGGPLRASFRIEEGELATWRIHPRESSAVSSGTLLFWQGELVGLTLTLSEPAPQLAAAWSATLQAPYRRDDSADHWETRGLKAKARRDGRRLYVVDKRFRADLPW